MMRMRAAPDERDDVDFGNDDDSEDEVVSGTARGPRGSFIDRSATASSVYYWLIYKVFADPSGII